MKQLKILSGVNRPAWSSMESNGMWGAYKHLHLHLKIKKNYFTNRKK